MIAKQKARELLDRHDGDKETAAKYARDKARAWEGWGDYSTMRYWEEVVEEIYKQKSKLEMK